MRACGIDRMIGLRYLWLLTARSFTTRRCDHPPSRLRLDRPFQRSDFARLPPAWSFGKSVEDIFRLDDQRQAPSASFCSLGHLDRHRQHPDNKCLQSARSIEEYQA